MTRRKSKSMSFGWLVIACLFAFGAAGAVTYYVKKNSGEGGSSKHKPLSVKPPVVTLLPDQRKVTIFMPERTSAGTYLVPITRTIEAKGNILDVAMSALLATNEGKDKAATLIPAGTKLLKPIEVKDGIATVDLSTQFLDNFSGGSDQEALTLNSIAHTLVHNSSGKVRKVLILVEGKTVDTLGGHFELADPIAADSTMLKPGSNN